MPCGTLSLEQLLYTADNHQQSDIDWYDVLCVLTFLLSPEEWGEKDEAFDCHFPASAFLIICSLAYI